MTRSWKVVAAALVVFGLGGASQGPTLPLHFESQSTHSDEVATSALPSAWPRPQLHRGDVDAWLDGFMSYAMAQGDIPGAVVVVVRDGQTLTARGFGYANLSTKTRADPRRTLFRPGSISKLFTWTALMQQVQAGKVDLQADVNRYLDFKIPPLGGKPITVLDLLTHTAGFEEQVKDLITTEAENRVVFEQILKRWVPKRVYAPGTTPAYSNYGASLAGYIVQRVSGQPFEAYIEQNIFSPLGMAHSTFRQPLPPALRPLMAEGYVSGDETPYGYEFVGPAPAGALTSTGEDMAKFMIAHLQNGGVILKPATARLMHSRARQVIPGLNGMAHGFYERSINGRRVLSHAGDTVAFHSDLNLFLDDGIGLFVSLNSAGRQGAAGALQAALFEKFSDRYLPGRIDRRQISAKAGMANAEKIAGLWSSARRPQSNFLSVLDLFGQTKVEVDTGGRLILPAAEGLDGRPRIWTAAGPMLWREAYGHELLGAKVENGRPVLLGLSSTAPIIPYAPVPLYRSAGWILPLLYMALGVLLLTAVLWPVRALVRRRFGATLSLAGPGLKAYRASRVMAVVILVVLAGWGATLALMLGDLRNLTAGFDPALLVLQLLSAIAFVGAPVIMTWYARSTWRGSTGWPAKAWSALLVLSALTVLYVAIVFHLIGWTRYY